MSETTRATIYLDSDLHRALRLKAASTHRSVSDLVAEAVREALREDQEDLSRSAVARRRTVDDVRGVPEETQSRWHGLNFGSSHRSPKICAE